MQLAQGIRQVGAKLRRMIGRLGRWLADLDPDVALKWSKRLGIVAVVFLVLYYPLGMIVMHRIDDDLTFGPSAVDLTADQSLTVSVVSALIDREVNQNGWVANDPFFLPSALLDNMPNYQMGMVGALARFSFELTDQIGRLRGSSQTDPDLQDASGLLQYSGTRWIWDPAVSLMPTASSEAQYLKARKALNAYNDRLARGEAFFERRSDNLLATLDRIALDIGSSSAALDDRIEKGAGQLIDTQGDDVFYGIKGQMYGYYMILRALKSDFEPVINDRDLNQVYDQMLDSVAQAASLQPWVVVNGAPDSQFMPSHLAAQGFFLLRARTQLREITNILLK